ncbi:Putative SOS response-associated peptidase YedK [Roseivivax lentus]|uniref:Abasic site processing protein n=1 Tax=Roseivivax lentus TaxID=633194 RepID=A0A1N7L7L1_9RHOB|nr:SOS response-associated peptidase [Roseivivax lentus]SIS69773.1 Putative SOS response-associated peptidase YedK [Roseivivax lentus]
MCGRFAITLPPDAMAQLFAAQPANDLPDVPNYNICPTNRIHVIRAGDTEAETRHLEGMRWGFLPHWYKTPNDGPLLINARAETVAEKPAFRSAARSRRCLVPATGFYEWTKDAEDNRLPWYVHRRDGAPMVFAGLWQDWGAEAEDGPLRSVAIVTCRAGGDLSAIHHRMPVVLDPADWPRWLGETGDKAAPLMAPAPDGTLDAYRVDPKVNSNRAKGPDLIEPLA